MQKGVQKIITYVNEHPAQYQWISINKTFSVTEITVPLPAWSKARRFVIIKKSLPKNDNGQLVFDELAFEYQAIVTNVDYLTPVEIFDDYNQRCNDVSFLVLLAELRFNSYFTNPGAKLRDWFPYCMPIFKLHIYT